MTALSVRTKLTLWNVGVLALTLSFLGFGIFYGARNSLLKAVDKEMQSRAQRVVSRLEKVNFNPPDNQIRLKLSGMPGGTPKLSVEGLDGTIDMIERKPGQYSGQYSFPPPPQNPNDPTRSQFRPRLLDMVGKSRTGEGPYDAVAYDKALRGEQSFTETTAEKEPIRVLSIPLKLDGKVVKVLQYPHPLTETYHALGGLSLTIFIVTPAILLIAALGGAFLTGRSLKPVREITKTAAQVSAESLSGRLDVKGDDEFSRLAGTFNGMLERLQGAFTRMEEAVEQQRRFTADASHELRTPLTVIKANTSLALRGTRTPEEYKRSLAAVNVAADNMNRLVGDLLLLARSDAGKVELKFEPVCLKNVLQEAVAGVTRPGVAPISLDQEDGGIEVLGDGHSLLRVFTNLLENAARHTPEHGQITTEVHIEGDEAVITVRDTGCGIAPEHLPHLCDRFYRVDQARARTEGGNGLGLAICASIVEAHSGSLIITSVVDNGTTVSVRIPLAI